MVLLLWCLLFLLSCTKHISDSHLVYPIFEKFLLYIRQLMRLYHCYY